MIIITDVLVNGSHLCTSKQQPMGYVAAFFIGISLGLIGGGGSILTLPALVYLFGIAPLHAISYSLFIVGTTSLAGAINNYRKLQEWLLEASSEIKFREKNSKKVSAGSCCV